MSTNSFALMSESFERKKNSQALLITIGVAGAMFLILIMLKWPMPTMPKLAIQEFLEVNLGNGDIGSGDDQPLLPGEPAPSEQLAYNPPTPMQASQNSAKDVETNDSDPDAPAVIRPSTTQPNATKINSSNKEVKTTQKTQEVVNPSPPKPKAVAGRTLGGNGNGGNGADTYKPGAGEGIAGGNGDQGRVGGSPNGTVYTGAPRNFGVKVLQISNQSFEDEFNENAKIAMEVTADAKGKVISAVYQTKGSTTSNRGLIDIAKRKAFELKLGSSDGGQKGVVIFNFVLKG